MTPDPALQELLTVLAAGITPILVHYGLKALEYLEVRLPKAVVPFLAIATGAFATYLAALQASGEFSWILGLAVGAISIALRQITSGLGKTVAAVNAGEGVPRVSPRLKRKFRR